MTETPTTTYGRTKSGLDITDELIERYVAEAEAGLDLLKLRPRGRPRMGAAPAKAFPSASIPTFGSPSTTERHRTLGPPPRLCERRSGAT